ncbi:hypothetical protein AA105894_2516 [Asaia spathodeae NBRC 105894]|nr:hypothetical protein AA105894_2516 [Asaia spathodeae NBRC 105894]
MRPEYRWYLDLILHRVSKQIGSINSADQGCLGEVLGVDDLLRLILPALRGFKVLASGQDGNQCDTGSETM